MKGNDMHGLGRFMAMQNLSGDGAGRNADDEWRALHRRPDALPLPDKEAEPVTGLRQRVHDGFRLRGLIARFGQH